MKIRKDGILDPKGKYPNPYTGKPYSEFYLEQAKEWSGYQTYLDRMEIFKKLFYYNIILVIAGTGVGKTVILPKLLAHYFHYEKPILVATPRQKTTEGAAGWASMLMDVPLFYYNYENGKAETILDRSKQPIKTGLTYVGYKHGGTKNEPLTSKKTNILFSTDSTIKQMIIGGDTLLEEYGGIVIDEAHERSVSIDVLIALVTDIVRKRPDFKVIIMSATVSEDIFINYFKNSGMDDRFTIYRAPGKSSQFDVPDIFLDKKIKKDEYIDKAYEITEKIIMNPKQVQINRDGDKGLGDILVFISTTSDANKLKNKFLENMNKYPKDAKPYPVILTSKTEELEKNIATGKGGLSKIPPEEGVFHRKLIIATNVAESSITFGDPLVYVIETGVEFSNVYDNSIYGYRAGVVYVAKANIKQRCGRTGRTSPGYCYRIYTQDEYDNEIKDYPKPKILTQDLTGDYLSILCLPDIRTVEKTKEFMSKMIQPFEDIKPQVDTSIKNLKHLGVISKTGKLRSLGYIMNKFGKFDYKVAKMIISGYYFGVLPECIALGSILSSTKGTFKEFFKPYFSKKANPKPEEIKKDFEFLDESGDHLTLLNYYLGWKQSYNKKEFVNKHQLSQNSLDGIDDLYDELLDQVIQIKEELSKLNYFNTDVPKLFGGSRINKFLNSKIKNININKKVINNKKLTNNKLTKKLYHTQPYNNYQYGGYKRQTSIKNNHTINRLTHNNIKFSNTNTKQSSYANIRLFGGKRSNKTKQGNPDRKQQSKSKQQFKSKQQSKSKQPSKSKEPTEEDLERYAKLRTLLETFTLKDIKKGMKIKPFNDKNKNILVCLLLGFANQMGIYTGDSNNYVIKYSQEITTIKGSILHKLQEKPKILIYNQFMNMDGRGKTLNTVSRIDKDIINIFL